jgi:sulfate transport system ATP-binding protein
MNIEVRSVSKRFGEFAAIDDITLDVPEGSLTALLGPSGSGKSTLLRVIAGLEEPDSGTVLIDGEDVTYARPQERGIGFVFQHYAAFTHMSVRENIAFGLQIRKRPRDEIRTRVDELLEIVGLTKWAGQRPSQLSGGQRQRMALARALAIDPRVLLLDEPFGALDAKVRAELRRWLRRLHEEQGVTTVLVTHDQEEAMEISDRIAVMNEGQLQQVGAPREVYDSPANEFVMGFLGPISKVGDQIVRPHDVAISLVPDGDAIEAMVSRVVHLGFEVRVELDLPDGTSARAQLTRGQTAELELARADIVYVRTLADTPVGARRPGAGGTESAGGAESEGAAESAGGAESASPVSA